MTPYQRLVSIGIFFWLFFTSVNFVSAQADPIVQNTKGYADLGQLEVLFGNVVSSVAILAGFAAFIVIIYGGFKYLIAQGDPKAIQAARATLTWGILGLVLIIGSWLILSFLSEFTGIDLTGFCLPTNGKTC